MGTEAQLQESLDGLKCRLDEHARLLAESGQLLVVVYAVSCRSCR